MFENDKFGSKCIWMSFRRIIQILKIVFAILKKILFK